MCDGIKYFYYYYFIITMCDGTYTNTLNNDVQPRLIL